MVLGGSAGLAVRVLTGFLLAHRSAPPPLPEQGPVCDCRCLCSGGAGLESFWAFLAGLFLGIALVFGGLLLLRSAPGGYPAQPGPVVLDVAPRYRPRYAAGGFAP